MNKKIMRSHLFCFVLFLAFASTVASADVRLGFRAYGGLNYLGGGDLNRGMEGIADALKLMMILENIEAVGEYSPAHLGMDIGGDLILEFTPSFGVSMGAGYVQSSKTSQLTFPNANPLDIITLNLDTNASAIRLSFQAYYVLPTSAGLSLVIHAGPDFYLAKVHGYANFANNKGDYIENDHKADGRGLGVQGGLGLEYDLSPNIGFFLEAVGRYADFAGFEGKTYVYDSAGPWAANYNGILYYYDYVDPTTGTQAIILCSPTVPTSPNHKNVREAKIDFSGFSIRLGAVFKFGSRT